MFSHLIRYFFIITLLLFSLFTTVHAETIVEEVDEPVATEEVSTPSMDMFSGVYMSDDPRYASSPPVALCIFPYILTVRTL